MNPEAEQIKKNLCPSCKMKDHSPLCIWKKGRKCKNYSREEKK